MTGIDEGLYGSAEPDFRYFLENLTSRMPKDQSELAYIVSRVLKRTSIELFQKFDKLLKLRTARQAEVDELNSFEAESESDSDSDSADLTSSGVQVDNDDVQDNIQMDVDVDTPAELKEKDKTEEDRELTNTNHASVAAGLRMILRALQDPSEDGFCSDELVDPFSPTPHRQETIAEAELDVDEDEVTVLGV